MEPFKHFDHIRNTVDQRIPGVWGWCLRFIALYSFAGMTCGALVSTAVSPFPSQGLSQSDSAYSRITFGLPQADYVAVGFSIGGILGTGFGAVGCATAIGMGYADRRSCARRNAEELALYKARQF